MPSRRKLLHIAIAGGLVGAAYGGTALLRRLASPPLDFEPLKGLPGFRRVAGGEVTLGPVPLAGLDAGSGTAPATDLCDGLFEGTRRLGDVPIAYFTDYRCVNCRLVSPLLRRLGPDTPVTWHELPLLGRASEIAAQAALAARNQGAYDAFHERLMGSPFLPNGRLLEGLAEEAGIDAAQLLADMDSAAVEAQLARSRALARRFGFVGTPALVVGRTAVLGRVDAARLDRLIAAERAEPAPLPC